MGLWDNSGSAALAKAQTDGVDTWANDGSGVIDKLDAQYAGQDFYANMGSAALRKAVGAEV